MELLFTAPRNPPNLANSSPPSPMHPHPTSAGHQGQTSCIPLRGYGCVFNASPHCCDPGATCQCSAGQCQWCALAAPHLSACSLRLVLPTRLAKPRDTKVAGVCPPAGPQRANRNILHRDRPLGMRLCPLLRPTRHLLQQSVHQCTLLCAHWLKGLHLLSPVLLSGLLQCRRYMVSRRVECICMP